MRNDCAYAGICPLIQYGDTTTQCFSSTFKRDWPVTEQRERVEEPESGLDFIIQAPDKKCTGAEALDAKVRKHEVAVV